MLRKEVRKRTRKATLVCFPRSGCLIGRSLELSRLFPTERVPLNICSRPLLTFGALSLRVRRAPQLRPPSGAVSAVPSRREWQGQRPQDAAQQASWGGGIEAIPEQKPIALRCAPLSDLRSPTLRALPLPSTICGADSPSAL